MSQATDLPPPDVPPDRIRLHPAPGTATLEDCLRESEKGRVTCELIDGTLVEKTVGIQEGYIEFLLGQLIFLFVRQHNLGIVLGARTLAQLFPDQARSSDAWYISHERLPPGDISEWDKIPSIVPDLAVEVISESNTKAEMDRKLREYFTAGVRLVWYVYPKTETVRVFTGEADYFDIQPPGRVAGGDVLPGFELHTAELFRRPS